MKVSYPLICGRKNKEEKIENFIVTTWKTFETFITF